MRRRILLSALAGSLAVLAGCVSPSGGEDGTMTDETTTAVTDGGRTDTGGGQADTDADNLDLREANVMGVEFERSGGDYRFSVTLLHDDGGEDGYANWWAVETPDGTELGRRTLLHAHSTREFTRSETISIPEETTCVVVRGHDQTHGYGGQAMLVNLETGEVRAERQGSEPKSVADAEC
ncbi:hypothetical protein [Haloferax larsenii]|uniref:Lipoprotein n=1 Tax=Haloferax larsenii TaxID=302484 RepID=A0A1H7RKC9_HALLR|nr:hypothetical protein [Haloferax larsenii]SEL60519.1 hypothetical protein SAMN04488691_10667 [Haloferax larsenii]